MEKQCVMNDCKNSTTDIEMFKLPVNNPELLKKWFKNIPKSIQFGRYTY